MIGLRASARIARIGGLAALALVLVALALPLAACTAPARTTFPPAGSTPAPAGDATAATRSQVLAALGGAGLQAVEAIKPFRPAEGPLLAAAPRTVLQVALAQDPDHGYIVIYSLDSPAAAARAAADHAAYIASPIGRVQFASDSHFVLRVVGATVVFFSWSPGSSPDPRTPEIEPALSSVGEAVAIPG